MNIILKNKLLLVWMRLCLSSICIPTNIINWVVPNGNVGSNGVANGKDDADKMVKFFISFAFFRFVI